MSTVTTNLAILIQMAREQIPVGTLPKSDESITLWVQMAAYEINRRRKLTTKREATILLVASQFVYDLPVDCITVLEGYLEGEELPGQTRVFPLQQFPNLAYSNHPFGFLPSGQRMTGSVDLIMRQDAARVSREISFRQLDGKLSIDFEPTTNQKFVIVYTAEDLSTEALPRRHWMLLLKYVKKEALDLFMQQIAINLDHVAEKLVGHNYTEIAIIVDRLDREWKEGLGAIQPEIN